MHECRRVLLRICLLLAAILALPLSSVGAEVRMPAIFGDGMVLQSGTEVAVWGRAAPGERVVVRVVEHAVHALAGEDGEWRLRLPPTPAGGPHRLTVVGENELSFENVLFGEVWLGAGQSNMGLPVECCEPTREELVGRPSIRMFQQMALPTSDPQWYGNGRWVECTPEMVSVFSGTLYYFGLTLERELGVPLGLIQASVGGTRIQSWIDRDTQCAHPTLAPKVDLDEARFNSFDIPIERRRYRMALRGWRAKRAELEQESGGHGRRGKPRNLVEFHIRGGNVGEQFNAKITPLIPFSIRGVVWYQGESNVREASFYEHQLRLLIADWRARWGQGDFPFAWVQLANFSEGGTSDWPAIREAMRRSLSIPNTGMAVALDLGASKNIHPRNKRDVGKRLAAWALGDVYGRSVPTSGPTLSSYSIDGPRVVLSFEHVDGGLHMSGDHLLGFEMMDEEESWRRARARIEAGVVVVESPHVPAPRHVRYAWRSNPPCTLYNGTGLPASPFTTESLSGDTQGIPMGGAD